MVTSHRSRSSSSANLNSHPLPSLRLSSAGLCPRPAGSTSLAGQSVQLGSLEPSRSASLHRESQPAEAREPMDQFFTARAVAEPRPAALRGMVSKSDGRAGREYISPIRPG